MAATCFADVPDDRNEFDIALLYAEPPAGLAVHTSIYDDGEYHVRFTFISAIELAPYRLPHPTIPDLQ